MWALAPVRREPGSNSFESYQFAPIWWRAVTIGQGWANLFNRRVICESQNTSEPQNQL